MSKQLQLRRGTTAQNDALTGAAGEQTFDTTLNQVRVHDGSTAGGFIVGSDLDSGTIMVFVQTNAPTGWTKLTTVNDGTLRVVSGAASSGGTDNFSTLFGSSKTTAAHTLTTAEIPSHTHTIAAGTGTGAEFSGYSYQTNSFFTDTTQTTSSVGSSGSHTHTLNNMDLKYLDVIQAQKD